MPDSAGHALFVSGVPGSGKSSFGRRAAAELGWTLLDMDTLTNPLYEFFGGEAEAVARFGASGERSGVNSVRYACLYDTAAENLAIGNSVVLVAPFTGERSSSDRWSDVLARLDVDDTGATLVWLDTPAEEAVRRMTSRGSERDRQLLKAVDSVLTPETTRAPAPRHIRIDGAQTTEEQLESFLRTQVVTRPGLEAARRHCSGRA